MRLTTGLVSAVGGASATMASIPSPTLIGVQRVVIACDQATGLTDGERKDLCEQLVKKARTVTSLPVALASAADLEPSNLALQSEQLLLRVSASTANVGDDRKTLALTISPIRAAVPVGRRAASTASVSFVNVQGNWLVQGPVTAFSQILGSAPPKLHRPIRAD